MSITLREDRLLVYTQQPGDYVEGFAFSTYALASSGEDDDAWWGAFHALDPFSLSAGLQQEAGVRAKVNFSSEVPVTETSLIRDLATGRLYKVEGVNTLTRADTIVVSCEWREDAEYTITDDATAYTVATVEVTPNPATLTVGSEYATRFTATARNSSGAEIPGGTPTWSTDAPAVLYVVATGVVEGLQAGTGTVTATMGDVAGSATVTVEAA